MLHTAYATIVPYRVRAGFRYKLEARRYKSYLKEQIGNLFDDVEPGPVPPVDVIMRTGIEDKSRVWKNAVPSRYYNSGMIQMRKYLKLLERNGFKLKNAGAAFEFGCGTARLLRHLQPVHGLRLVGSDVTRESVDWCTENLPEIEFYQNQYSPPLEFATDDCFDLVIAHSVFTHIDLEAQGAWLDELSRVMRPGGYFVCTMFGKAREMNYLSGTDQIELKKQGFISISGDDPRATPPTKLNDQWDLYVAKDRIVSEFGSRFEILDWAYGRQDTIILRKPTIS